MEVTLHDGVVTPSCRDDGDVDLQEFRWVGRPVVLLRQVRPELGWSGHRAEMLRERDAAHTSHRGLDMTLGPWCRRAEIGVKVPTLDVEPAFTCSLHGDAGVLFRTPAVEFCPQISCPRYIILQRTNLLTRRGLELSCRSRV